MSTPPLQVRRLTVRRMYGARFDGLRADGLCTGLNVVYGPNGAGKTTLARALQTLLWPGLDGVGHTTLEGRFTLGEADWHLALDGTHLRCQRDGQPATAPPLPPPDRRDCYYLHLHELLAAESDGDTFARAIHREAVGGIDVRQAAAALGFKPPSPRRGTSTAAVPDAHAALRRVEQRQQALQRDEQQLADLHRRRDAARAARTRCEVLQHALDACRTRTALAEARRDLDAFPDVMEAVDGGETDRLEALRATLQQAQVDRAEAVRRLDEAHAAIAASRIDEEALPDGHIDRCEHLVQRIDEAEQAAARSRRDVAGARRRAEATWARIDGATDEAAAAQLDLSDIGQLAELVQEAEQTRAQQRALAAMEHLFADAQRPSDGEAWRDASRYLEGWLAHARAGGGPAWSRARVLVAFTVLMLVVAAAAVGLLLHPFGWALLLPAVLLTYLLAVLRPTAATPERQATYRRDFERLPVPPPARWTPDDVRARLHETYVRRAEHRVQEAMAARWASAASERDALEQHTEAVRQRRHSLAARLGLAPDVAEEQLYYVIEHLLAWQQARADFAERSGDYEAARDDVQHHLDALHALLAPYGYDRPADGAEAAAQVRTLGRAEAELLRALDQRSAAQRDRARLDEAEAAVVRRLDALFAKRGLSPGDDAALHALCRRHDAYHAARTACARAEAVADQAHTRLAEHPLFEASLPEATEAALQQRLDDAAMKADQEHELADRIARIEQRLDDARQSHDREEARAAVADAASRLADERERDYRLAAGHVLTEYLHRRTRDHDRPAVFHRAKTLFTTITRGRYGLDLDDGRDAFRAYDHVLERGLALDELSSGTRVQLLLAVRIAFVEQHEQGCRLPLVLDEALANSDDERAAAVIDAVLALCRTGRQVFYLTAQQDEVAKWRAATSGQHDVTSRFIPLAGAPAPDAIDASAQPAPLAASEVPPPDDLSHAAYGERLGVPPWDAYQPLGALHLWHLVEDTNTLHALLRRGLTTWGQLRHLIEDATDHVNGLSATSSRRIALRAEALAAWQTAWRLGRGRRVHRAVLEASGAVSDTFIDRVAALCEEQDGDARALLAALDQQAVPHWHRTKTEELRAYLLQHGYLDDAAPLSDEQIWAHTLRAVNGELATVGLDVDALDRLFERVRRSNASA